MNRLDRVLARNQRPRFNERTIVTLLMGIVILVILALAAFTDWGRPPVDEPPKPAPVEIDHTRVPGVQLRSR